MTNSILHRIGQIEKKIQSLHAEAADMKLHSEQRAVDIANRKKKAEQVYQSSMCSIDNADQQIISTYKKELTEQNDNLSRIDANLKESQSSQMSAIRRKYENIKKNDREYIDWLDKIASEMPQKLLVQYGGKPHAVSARKPDLDSIRALYERIVTDTAESFAKKIACIDGYYHQADMQRDLVIACANAKCYLEGEIVRADAECQADMHQVSIDIEASLQQSINSKSSSEVYAAKKKESALQANKQARIDIEEQKKRECEQIAVLELQYKEANQKDLMIANMNRQEFFSSALITNFTKETMQNLVDTGSFANDWQYSISRKPSQMYSLGKIHVPVRTESRSIPESLKKAIPDFFDGTCFRVPLLLKTTGVMQTYMQYDVTEKSIAYQIPQLFILQKMRSNPANHLQIYFADPNDRGQNLGVLIASNEENEAIGIKNQNTKEGIRALLREIVEQIDNLNGALGNYNSIFEYNQKSESRIKETILVLCDVQNCIDQETLPFLKVIWENAARCGINVILSSQSAMNNLNTYYPNAKMDWSFLSSEDMYYICYTSSQKYIKIRRVQYNYEVAQIKQAHSDFLSKYRECFAESLKIENRFDVLYNKMHVEAVTEEQRRFGKAFGGIKLPIFIDTARNAICQDFILGTENSQHMIITGGTGSGKSRLLHSIIAAIVMNYHPDDVELWLVDCKKVEFELFMRMRPEHVRMVSLERSKEFAFAFFDYLLDFAQKRTRLLTDVGVNNLKDYRKVKGDPYCMPRVVIIMDEFHAITEHLTQDYKYRQLLEDALSEYRNLGISFIFSDQSVSGLKGFTEKSKQQIHYRIAMRGMISEMKETLGVLNENYTSEILSQMENSEGHGDSWWNKNLNVRYKNIYISNETSEHDKENGSQEERFLRDIIAKTPKANQDNRVFLIDGNSRVPYQEEQVQTHLSLSKKDVFNTNAMEFCLGIPTTLDPMFSFQLSQKYNNNVLISGRDTRMTVDVLLSIIRSANQADDVRVILLAECTDVRYQILRKCQINICRQGAMEIYDDYEEICRVIDELHSEIQKKRQLDKKTLVIWLGLTDIYDEFCVSPKKETNRALDKSDSKKAEGTEIFAVDSEAVKNNPEMIARAEQMGVSVEDLLMFFAEEEDEVEAEITKQGYVYNATQDMLDMFAMGGKYGLFNVVSLEYSYDAKRIKGFKIDNFIHKIAFCMSRDESVDWGYRSAATELTEGLTALYTDGISQQTFKPYIMVE